MVYHLYHFYTKIGIVNNILHSILKNRMLPKKYLKNTNLNSTIF